MPLSPEIEKKAREVYEKVRLTGTVQQGEPWEPIAEALAEMQVQIDSFQAESTELAREVADLEAEAERSAAQ